MTTEIISPVKLISFEKIDTAIYATAALYNKLGVAEYAAMEAFVRWKF